MSYLIPDIQQNLPQFQKKLGEGTYGDVNLCIYEGRQLAVKRLK